MRCKKPIKFLGKVCRGGIRLSRSKLKSSVLSTNHKCLTWRLAWIRFHDDSRESWENLHCTLLPSVGIRPAQQRIWRWWLPCKERSLAACSTWSATPRSCRLRVFWWTRRWTWWSALCRLSRLSRWIWCMRTCRMRSLLHRLFIAWKEIQQKHEQSTLKNIWS